MSNQKYFDVPFGFSGDKTAIPDPLQTGGTVSFTEGWNYNYQRNLSTDPAALPIDRSTMNWLFDQITTAIQQLQQTGTPEFILASQNGGVAFPYGPQAAVLWSASGNAPFTRFINITGATNSNTPSLSDPLGATSGWQVSCDPIATSAQAGAGTDNAHIMTPLLVAQQTALRALLAGSATQVFNVGPATAATHAPEVGQLQQNVFNYASLAGGTANALTATLAPAPTAYTDDLVVVVRVSASNTGATTLNLNGLGVKNVVGSAHAALQGGELINGGFACFAYSVAISQFVLVWATGGAEQVGTATQSQHAATWAQAQMQSRYAQFAGAGTSTWTVPAGVTAVYASGCGPGAGGGGGAGGNTSNGGGGGGGGGAGQHVRRSKLTVTPGQILTIVRGTGGTAGAGSGGAAGGNGGNGSGPTTVSNGGTTLVTLAAGSAGSGGVFNSTLSGAGYGGAGFPNGGAGASATPQAPFGVGGWGGSCPFGGGGAGGYGGVSSGSPSTQGGAGYGYGAGGGGGGGGYLGTSNTGFNGGTGADGFIELEW